MAAFTVESIHLLLLHTFNADEAHRKHAEGQLEQLVGSPGAPVLLLQIVAHHEQVQREVRQASAIALKNMIKKGWDKDSVTRRARGAAAASGPVVVSPEDKVNGRHALLETLMAEPDTSIRALLAECVNLIAYNDYPEQWPQLLPTISANVQSGQPRPIQNALLALRKVVKRFEFKPRDARGPLDDIIAQVFPLLQQLVTQLLANNVGTLEAAEIMKLSLKVFWSCTQFCLPPGACENPAVLRPWFEMLHAVLAKPLPEASAENAHPPGQPTEPDARAAWPWWKLKKWAAQICSRFLLRYGNPKYADAEAKHFARDFRTHIAPLLLGPMMDSLALRARGAFCSDRVTHLALMYVTSAIELGPLYKLLAPHLDFLLFEVVFPLMCITPADIERFETDPHEFVRLANDPMEDFFDPRYARNAQSRGRPKTTRSRPQPHTHTTRM